MMNRKQITEFSLQDGTKFLVEVDEPENSNAVRRVARPDTGQMVVEAKKKFDEVLDQIQPVASAIITKLSQLNTPANEVEVKFGIKLNAAAGAIFTSVSGADFSRDVEKVILMLSQALISPLAIFINSELLRISLWKNLRFLGA
ncbi:MAG: CU044_2847 family protein [Nostoc sp.]|uniref:CU044_2847 family protein n=1 Tax=Nostoc sp. TaxID=1180 RepID=UPI002FF80C7B